MKPTNEIVVKRAKPLRPGLTFFDLPGGLRNKIYSLVLQLHQERVPCEPVRPRGPVVHLALQELNLPLGERRPTEAPPRNPSVALYETENTTVNLLQASFQVAFEARGLLQDYTRAYVPAIRLRTDHGLLKGAVTDSVKTALEHFMTVHFHLHLDITKKEDFDPEADLANLHDLLKEYMAHSPAVSKKHRWRRRRAIVHLDT
jgi:hypothetical protein